MQTASCNLEDCFLCSHCLPEWKEVVAVKKETLSFKKGKPLFSEGDKVNGIFFIYSGSVKVHKQWLEQKELLLRFAKKGDIVGHRGLGRTDLYPVSATALEDTRACFIGSDFLEATLRTNHALTYRLMQFYVTELQKTDKRMHELAHMEVKGRIANALLEIAAFFGLNKEKFISVAITRQDIASYAGTSYETVFKFFTELVRLKIISTSGKSIRIHRPDLLGKYVG
jgi:CRP/FNR family transcriptional regulator